MWNKAREARDRRPSDVLSVEKIVADELHEWELLEKADLPGPEQTRAEIQALLKRQTGLDLPGALPDPLEELRALKGRAAEEIAWRRNLLDRIQKGSTGSH